MKWVDDIHGDWVNLELMIKLYVRQPQQDKNTFFVCCTDGAEEFKLRRFTGANGGYIWMRKFITEWRQTKYTSRSPEEAQSGEYK